MHGAEYSFNDKRQVGTSRAVKTQHSCAVYTNPNLWAVSMASNRDGNLRPGKYQGTESERRSGESQPSNRHLAMRTDPSYVQDDIARDKVQEIYKVFAALAVFKRTNIEEIKQIMNAEQELSEQRSEISRLKKRVELMDEKEKNLQAQLQKKDMQLIKLNQGRNWNVEHEKLAMRHIDLQRKYDKIKDESRAMVKNKTMLENEIKTLRSKLKETERECSQQKGEISRLINYVKSKAQLPEKVIQLLEQKQGRYWKEQVELRHHDVQTKYDKTKYESQAITKDKTKLENEIETLRSKLRKTEQEFLEKANEMSRLKKHVELVDEESNSLKALLHEKDMQLLKQKQGSYWNMEKEQLEMMHNDLQRKFDKIKDESQAMVMDKTKRENDIETLRSKLRKTEQDLSEKTSEISRLKTHVESVEEESKSLKTHLQEKDMLLLKQNQGRNWNEEYEQLETRHKDLQRKFDKIKDESQAMVMDKTKRENEIETLRSKLRKTEQEFAEKTSELSRLKKYVESVDEESKSLKAHLHEADTQLLKHKQGRNLNVEYEQLEMRYNDLQRKFDKIKDESQAMVMDKSTLENEIEKLRNMLRKTEQELSEKTSEIFTLKAHVESVDEESKSLKAQLQEKDMLLLKQNQGRNWNGEYKQLELRHKDLQQKFDKIKDESQAMVMDKTKLENENEKLRSMLRKTELEFSKQKSEINRLKKRLESVDEESKSLIEQLQEKEMQLLNQKQGLNLNAEYEQLKIRYKDLQRKYDRIEDETQAMMVDKTKLKNENEKLSVVLKKTEQESLEQKSEISKLKKRVEKMDQELASFKANLQQNEMQLQEQRLATKKAYAEKDDALTRLSRHMGQQMSEGNPNITDLSDQNRPSKLGERYSELYDNEWTDAFECLTDKFEKDDKEVIEVLRTILLETYKRALDFSISQMKEAEYKLSGSTKGVGPECKRLLKDARKHIDIKQADSLLEDVLEGTLSKVVDRRYLREAAVQVFAKECFQLCWFMSIQDPPVALVEKLIQDSRFDTNMYKHYTNSGDTVDYVVWPALLLHKDGPLLTKGVAQPFPRLTPK